MPHKSPLYFGHAYTGASETYLAHMAEIRRRLETEYAVLSFIAKGQVTPRQTYENDAGMVRECDIFVADASEPSTGLGVELMVAYECGKPTLLISAKDGNPSKMAIGIPNPRQEFFEYGSVDEAIEAIRAFIGKYAPREAA